MAIIREVPLRSLDLARVARDRELGFTKHTADEVASAVTAVRAALDAYYAVSDRAQALIDTRRVLWIVPDEWMTLERLSNGSELPSIEPGNIKCGADAYPTSKWLRNAAQIRNLTRRLARELAAIPTVVA